MNLEDREVLAKAATQGKWDELYVFAAVRHVARNCDFISGGDPEFAWDRYTDAAHIAANDPQTILGDIAELKAHRAFVEAFREWWVVRDDPSYRPTRELEKLTHALATVNAMGEQS